MTNREAQAGALPGRLGRHKRVEHLLDDVPVDPWPVVLDDQLYDTNAIGRPYLDPPLAIESVCRIEQQVQQQLSQAFVVTTNSGESVVQTQSDVNVVETGLAVDQFDGVGYDLGEVRGGFDPSVWGRCIPREIQEITNRVVDSLSLALNAAHELLLLFRVEVPALHQVEQSSDRGERVPDLVCDACR